jgi:hypothetical protein
MQKSYRAVKRMATNLSLSGNSLYNQYVNGNKADAVHGDWQLTAIDVKP